MNNHQETILVTGATGTVGSEVVKHLAALSSSDHNIRAAVHSKNKSDQLRQFENRGVEIVDMDYTKQETIAHALNNVDKVFLQTLPVPNVVDISSNLINNQEKWRKIYCKIICYGSRF
jgi:NAD(P)H dehydrogenase (quinone)